MDERALVRAVDMLQIVVTLIRLIEKGPGISFLNSVKQYEAELSLICPLCRHFSNELKDLSLPKMGAE